MKPCLTPANLILEDNEPPDGFNTPPCLALLPSIENPSRPIFSAMPFMSKLVIPITSAVASSAILSVVATFPSPLNIVLLGTFNPLITYKPAVIWTCCPPLANAFLNASVLSSFPVGSAPKSFTLTTRSILVFNAL